jgi:hypothetical protein
MQISLRKNAGFLIMVFSSKDHKLTLQSDSEKRINICLFLRIEHYKNMTTPLTL